MVQRIRILILEDNASDVELIRRALRKAALDFTSEWAHDRKSFIAALDNSDPDIILADYSLPEFDGMTALTLARERFSEIPVIIVSGAIGEETAIETLKAGATDYVLKQRLQRLGPSIQRALQEVQQTADRRRAEQALRESEERFRLLVEGAKDYAILMIDDAGCVTTWNSGAQRIIGYTASEILGQNFSRFFRPEDVAGGIPQQEMAIAAQQGQYTAECWRVRQDGTQFWASVTLAPLCDAAGRPRGFAKIVGDMTEHKRAEAELQSLNETLECHVNERTAEANHRAEQLRQLASELASAEHRERQRIAHILHDGLQQILVGAKYQLAVAVRSPNFEHSAAQLSEIIDDAIEMSRSLTAELCPPVLLQNDLISALEWLALWMFEKHGLEVKLVKREKIDPLTQDVLLLLFQAARELLFNVVKHSGIKTVQVEVGKTDGRIVVSVEDKGAGFDPSQLRPEGGKAGGFGLFSIRERFSLVGGKMEIDSTPGKGSRFQLMVPLSIAALNPSEQRRLAAAEVHDVRESEQSLKKIRIVLVDDHKVVREGLAGLLRGEPDFEVAGEASDGKTGLKLIRKLRPDVVLMDINMPGMDGVEATRLLHREMPEISVIGLSTFEESGPAAAIRKAGAVGYVTKSGGSQKLIESIRACVPNLKKILRVKSAAAH